MYDLQASDAYTQCNDSCVYHDVQVYYFRASSEVERQRWVTALTLAKAKAVKDPESGILFNTHQLATYTCSQHIGIMHRNNR